MSKQLALFLYLTGPILVPAAHGTVSVSREQLFEVLKTLASDEMMGRESGAEGAQKARAYLLQSMTELGLKPWYPLKDLTHSYEGGTNLVGVVYPKGGDEQARPKVLLSAHYDHIGSHCRSLPEAASAICNGATDNAAAVAACLALIAPLREVISSPVLVVFWDSEEHGMAGSKQFVADFPEQIKDLDLMVNLDIVGLNLFKGLEQHHLAIGAASGGQQLQADLLAAIAASGLQVHQLSYAFGSDRSDMSSFYNAGVPLPFVFLSDGNGKVYHTTADELAHVNMDKVCKVAELAGALVVAAAEKEKHYDWVAPTALGPHLVPPVFSDARVLVDLLDALLKAAALNQLEADQIAQLEQDRQMLQGIVATVESGFNPLVGSQLGKVTQNVLALSAGLKQIP